MATLQEKLANKTLTVREAIDIATEGAVESRVSKLNTLSNKLRNLGIDLDGPFTELGIDSNLELLSKEKGQPFAALTTVQNAVNGAAARLDMEPPFPDYSAKAQSSGLLGGKQSRNTKKFDVVPEARITFPAIIQTIAQVEDPHTRAALALNALVPLRPGEIASLTLDDIDLETGMLTEKVRGQKTRAKFKIPDVALEIIRDAAELAEQEGRTNIFDTTVAKMTKAINAPGGLRDLLKPYAAEMGREIEGAKDLRKLIPSIVAMELGFREEASAIMGHADASKTMESIAKMSSEHYISPIMRAGQEARPTIALRALQHMYGEVLGLSTLNELPAAFNVSAKRITGSNIAIEIIREQEDILQPSEARELTPEEKQLIEDRRKLASAQIEAQTAEAQLRVEQATTQKAEAIVKRQGLTEEAARIKAEENERRRLARQQQKQQTEAEARDAEIAKTEAKVTGNPNNMSAARARKAIMDSITGLGGKALKGLGIYATGEALYRSQAAAREGKVGEAVGFGLEALGSPLPLGEMAAGQQQLRETQERERQYGEGRPVFSAEALFGRGKQEESPQPSTQDQMDSLGISPDSSYP